MKEFMDFVKQVGVLGVAVGFALGQAVYRLVESVVLYVLDPLVASIFDQSNFSQKFSEVDGSFVQWGVPVVLAANVVVMTLVLWGLVVWLNKKPAKKTTKKTTKKKK